MSYSQRKSVSIIQCQRTTRCKGSSMSMGCIASKGDSSISVYPSVKTRSKCIRVELRIRRSIDHLPDRRVPVLIVILEDLEITF